MGSAAVAIRQRAEQRPEQARRARAAARPPRPGELTPQALLALQRGAGNASVARLVEEKPDLEVRFPLDADGDGKDETKRLFIEGEGEEAELYINPEPMVFQKFLQNNKAANTPAVAAIVKRVRELMKKPITGVRGLEIETLLERLAGEMKRSFNVEVPPSTAHTWTHATISWKSISERVTTHLIVEPLSARPGPRLTGSGVQNAKTAYMKALHDWSGYVRGHMLNAKLHGPGIDENLVPISGTFNADMKNGVEEHLKDLVSSQNLVVSYEIKPKGWGGYLGTRQGQNIETTLPDSFEMHVRPMRLRQPGLDGTDPANWVRSGQNDRVFTQHHTLPGSQRFDESAAPKLLGAGVYYPDDLQALWKNNSQPGVWVYQGRLQGNRFTGEPMQERDFANPTNLAGQDATGHPVPIVRHDDALYVTSAATAKQQLDHLDHTTDYKLKNLNDRLGEAAQLLGAAKRQQEAIEQALSGWASRSTERANALQQRGLDVARYGASSQIARGNILNENEHRKARLGVLDPAHAEHARKGLEVAAGWKQHTQEARALLAQDEKRFYSEQDAREARWEKLTEDHGELTFPNLQAISELKEILRIQAFVDGNVYRAEADERVESDGQLAAWERQEAARRAREEEQARRSAIPQFDFSHIDLGDLQLPSPIAFPSPLHAQPSSPAPHRGRSPVRRDEHEPAGYRKLIDALKLMMRSGRRKLNGREAIAEYDAWAKNYIKVVARETRGARRLDRDARQGYLKTAYRARNQKLEQLGVEIV